MKQGAKKNPHIPRVFNFVSYDGINENAQTPVWKNHPKRP
jgi:hypothetical protein